MDLPKWEPAFRSEIARPRVTRGARRRPYPGTAATSHAPRASLLVLIALAAAGPQPAAAAEVPEPPESPEPLLTLEDALEAARAGNRLVANAATEVERSSARRAALRARRLPVLRLDALGLRLLEPLDFTFPAGVFGVLPPVGPIPPARTAVRTPADFTATVLASVSQPLTQQYRIGLGIHLAELGRDLAGEELRRERQRVAADVRTAYYQLSATRAGVAALRDLVRALEELDALTSRYAREELVLRADALEVKARLARERHRLSVAESGLATQHEHLNQLLGRDLATAFRVAEPASLTAPVAALGLDAARERARARRPEVREAAVRADQAETALRLARADWIPDLSLAAAYARLVNFNVLPDHVAVVGLYLRWEPFDWGRRGDEASDRAGAVEQALRGRAEAAEQIAVEVGLRWRALKDAAGLLEASGLDVEAAQANLETVTNLYREDAKMIRDVLQAEARLSGARHDLVDARAGYWSAAAELERAIGDDE